MYLVLSCNKQEKLIDILTMTEYYTIDYTKKINLYNYIFAIQTYDNKNNCTDTERRKVILFCILIKF